MRKRINVADLGVQLRLVVEVDELQEASIRDLGLVSPGLHGMGAREVAITRVIVFATFHSWIHVLGPIEMGHHVVTPLCLGSKAARRVELDGHRERVVAGASEWCGRQRRGRDHGGTWSTRPAAGDAIAVRLPVREQLAPLVSGGPLVEEMARIIILKLDRVAIVVPTKSG